MTTAETATGPTVVQRWRAARWVVLALVAIIAVAALGAYLTAPRPGGRMDPSSTSPEGARALVALLRDRGVRVITADNVSDVEQAAGPDTLLVAAQTFNLVDDELLQLLAAVPGDRLLVEPAARFREVLAPAIRTGGAGTFGGEPDCDLREATRAGTVQFGAADTFEADGGVPVTSCYDGAVVRYTVAGRTVTAVSSAEFMTNSGLLEQGNAALAMNLAGTKPQVIWYAPQRVEGESGSAATIFDLIPNQVIWIVWQLGLVVALVAVWRGRRIGPLVAEELPVVVRASETVEGRGRLYRSRQARDRAADALRIATLQRLTPRLGLGANTTPPAVVQAVAERCGHDPAAVGNTLFGPPPTADSDLVNLANRLDDIERQVAHS